MIKNYTNIGNDIPVGKEPSGIGPDDLAGKIYVANSGDKGPDSLSGIYVVNRGDDTVSVIDPETNNVVAKVMFNIEPFNAGHIECDKLITPIEQQFYVYSGSECIAKPNQGFEFVSWQENLSGNSTQFIKLSSTPTILDSILEFFHMNPDKPESKLNITKFGSFTANFKALPPPIPQNMWQHCLLL